jgi:predicted transcriptional regulator
VLNGQLEFLIGNQLVEERVQKKERVVYAITQKGLSVLKSFREIRQIFPEEEERKVPTLY